MRRPAVACDIRWRGTRNEMQRADSTRDQGRVGKLAAAHRAINPFFDQVDHAVTTADFKLDIRVALEKTRQCRNDQIAAERTGNFDSQSAARAGARGRQRVFGFAHIGKNAQAAFVIGGTVGGHADLPRGTVEQLDRQRGFEIADQRRHRGLRQLHIVSRARKSAGIDHLHKDFHCLQLVHCRLSD